MAKKQVVKNTPTYDVAVIGAGPAGLMAAVYAGGYHLKAVVFGEVYGGTISTAYEVGNFPGFTRTSGIEISQKMVEQAKSLGAEVVPEKIMKVEKEMGCFEVSGRKTKIRAKKVILSVGAKRKRLGLAKEEALTGRGVSYCTACDGVFFQNKVVAVVGGGNSALSAAVQLSDMAKKVYLIYRGEKFVRAEPEWVKPVEADERIEKIFGANVVKLFGNLKLEKIRLDTGKELEVDGLFVEIGSEPDKAFIKKLGLETDGKGYVIVDGKMRTNIHGLLAAGEITSGIFAQAIVAAAQGAIAANTAYEEIKIEGTC